MDDLDTVENKIADLTREMRKLHAIRRDLQLAYVRRNLEHCIGDCSESDANKLFEITRKLEHRFNQE